MKKSYVFFLPLILGLANLEAQSVNPVFIGSCDNDRLNKMAIQDQYIYGIGSTNSFGATNGDIYLFKTDTSGHTVWARQIGTGSDVDAGISLAVRNNNIFVSCNIPHEDGTSLLMHLDTSGISHGAFVLNNTGTSMIEMTVKNDGGPLYCGFQVVPDHYLPLIVSSDASGNIVWSKTIIGETGVDTANGNGIATGIHALSDGNILVTGSMMAHDTTRPFLAKLDASGNLLWFRNYRTPCLDGYGNVFETTDGNYMICGSTPRSNGDGYDAFLIKTSASGNLLYSYVYNIDQTAGTLYSQPQVRLISHGSGFLLTGTASTDLAGTYSDYYAIHLNASGDVDWAKKYGNDKTNICDNTVFTGSYFVMAGYSTENTWGNAVVGYDQEDVMLLKVSTGGTAPLTTADLNINKSTFATDTIGNTFSVNDMVFAPSGYAPYVNNVDGTYDSTSCFGLNVASVETHYTSMNIYPNPASNYTEIRLPDGTRNADIFVRNLAGEVVLSQSNIANGKALINVNGFAPGLYLVTAKSGQHLIGTQKLVVN